MGGVVMVRVRLGSEGVVMVEVRVGSGVWSW